MKDLTYRVSKYPTGPLSTEEVDKTVAQALKLWSDITELTFSRKDTGQVLYKTFYVFLRDNSLTRISG